MTLGQSLKKSKITQIFEQFGTAFLANNKLNEEQSSVFGLVKMCRTGKLGTHKEKCTSCGHTKVHYNSCGNRHCPNCQGMNKERWILEREQDLLPVIYFHGVFTVPSQLTPITIQNDRYK